MKHFNFYNEKEFIQDCINKHGDYYDYSIVVLGKSIENIEVICPKHGDFKVSPGNFLKGSNCQICSNNNSSKSERELFNFIKELYPDSINNNYGVIKPYELDIYIPDLKKAIEFNGMYWHYDHSNPRCKPRGYHAQKSKLCRQKGIRLLHLREDLWIKNPEKMKQIIIKFLK